MRRIGRWMLNALTALSLLLFVGTCVLWVRSVSNDDRYWGRTELSAVSLRSYRHQLAIIFVRRQPPPANLPDQNGDVTLDADMVHDDSPIAGQMDVQADGQGFAFIRVLKEDPTWAAANFPSLTRFDLVAVPHWFAALVAAVLPVVKVWAILRQRRWTGAGGCSCCGYDLTGNVSGVCPECGVRIAEVK